MQPTTMSDSQDDRDRILQYVITAVAVWGGLLAIGALLFGLDPESNSIHYSPNLLRGLIVLACVAVFLGSWILLLAARGRRVEHDKASDLFDPTSTANDDFGKPLRPDNRKR